MIRLLSMLLVILCVSGCASFMHWQHPTLEQITAEYCGERAEQRRAELEQQAKHYGLNIVELLNHFRNACLLRLPEQADRAGMQAVRLKLAEARTR